MRAERLLNLIMLLKTHGQMTVARIAAELDVSERTVLRDIDALSLSGVPVYTERGRHGGVALVPGYRTDLTGLTPDEAAALLAAGGRLESTALSSAMRKIAAALPEAYRPDAMRAAQRVLVRPEGFVRAPVPLDALGPLQQAVFDGRRVRLDYRRPGSASAVERIVDPVGLIVAGDTWYLVANVAGAERMYRVSRISDVTVLDVPAERADDVDLDEIWQRRRAEFRAGFESLDVVIDCAPDDVARFTDLGIAVTGVAAGGEHAARVVLHFGDRRRAERTLWAARFDIAFRVVEPAWIHESLAAAARAAVASPTFVAPSAQ